MRRVSPKAARVCIGSIIAGVLPEMLGKPPLEPGPDPLFCAPPMYCSPKLVILPAESMMALSGFTPWRSVAAANQAYLSTQSVLSIKLWVVFIRESTWA